jgi:hypothetical protein
MWVADPQVDFPNTIFPGSKVADSNKKHQNGESKHSTSHYEKYFI